MPCERIPGTDLTYYLIAFDADGWERTDDADGSMSHRLMETLAGEPITDVFLMSHGWQGDVPAARDQYGRWTAVMAGCDSDLDGLRQLRPRFAPLLVGLHWPSLPWGDEELLPSPAYDVDSAAASISGLVEEYAGRLAETPAARAALETIFASAMEDAAPLTLPREVRDAYAVLDREAALGGEGVGGAPGDDREPFDAERAYQASLDEGMSFGTPDFGGVLSPLRQLSFWKMKQRARRFGETGGYKLLSDLQKTASVRRDVRFHLMGHSFGCIAVSAMVAGPRGLSPQERAIHSLALVQGALSLWAYCSDIPAAPGRPGYFHSIVAAAKVTGPIVTTQSERDTAVGTFYPLAAGLARHVDFVPGELPKYGAVGTFGIRGPGPNIIDLSMKGVNASYQFRQGEIYNLEASPYIREGGGLSGAHSDIARPEVAHAIWQAAIG